MIYDLKQLERLAKKNLSEKRYYHTACVVKQAQKLARIYGCDQRKAMTAAWLHDICKEMKPETQLQWAEKYGIILDDTQRTQPKTWHGMAACGYMKLELEISDPEVLHAVQYHTTACAEMSELDEVVYLADLTSADRSYPDIERIRGLAESSLKPAMKEAMRYAIEDLAGRSLCISMDTFGAYNYYMSL